MFWDSRKPPQREYKTLHYVGRLPKRMNLKPKDVPYHRVRSLHSNRLGMYADLISDIAGKKYAMVEPSLENVNKTISSFDGATFSDFRSTIAWKHAIDFLDSEYKQIFDDCVATSEETASYIDWSKSGGYTATSYGINTKGELIMDPGFQVSLSNLKPELTVPLTTVANKKEPKEVVDIMEQKIRLFFISEFHHVRSQIKFGKRSSLKLMNYKWSAYGFNPFLGGVNRMARKLLSKPIRFYYDVSGWDKFIPLMADLYDWIRKVSRIPPELQKEFEWMIKNTIAFFCVLWDGDVVLKNYGNASGSGTTTRDNILMHVILAAMFLSEAYYNKMGVLPPFELLAEQICYLFGDDSVFAVDEEFDYVLHGFDEEDGFLRSFFKRFGMKLKFLRGGLDFPVTSMEFLGFVFTEYRGIYIPSYDIEKLANSFIYTNDKADTLDAYVSKCFVLTMMSFSSPHLHTFLGAYKLLLSSLHGELTPVLKSFQSVGPMTEDILFAFYSGAESAFRGVPFLHCDWWLEVEKTLSFLYQHGW